MKLHEWGAPSAQWTGQTLGRTRHKAAVPSVAGQLLLLLGVSGDGAHLTAAASSEQALVAGSAGRTLSDSVPPVSRGSCGRPGLRCCDEDDYDYYYSGQPPACSAYGYGSVCAPFGTCVVCGPGGAPCCPDGTCNDRHTCNEFGFCEEICGRAGLPCCTDTGRPAVACVIDGAVCMAGMCEACGDLGQPCCDNEVSACLPNGLRLSSTPVQCDEATRTCVAATCGEIGLPCCAPGVRGARLEGGEPANTCDYNSAFCANGTCEACGFAGTSCCPDRSYECFGDEYFARYTTGICSEDNICEGGAPLPLVPPPPRRPDQSCGFTGSPCCGPEDAELLGLDGECRGGSFAPCIAGICTTCGDDGYECCEGGVCRGDTNFCDENNICNANCGGTGERCCAGESTGCFGRICDAESGTCVDEYIECGRRGQTCCEGDFEGDPYRSGECDATYAPISCVSGTCATCGFDGDACCPLERFPDFYIGNADRPVSDRCFGNGAVCGPDYTCSGALPYLDAYDTCGLRGTPCCPGNPGLCIQGTVCEDSSCVPCGREGDRCCDNDRCDGGGPCLDGVCGPRVCGERSLPCCTPDEELFACSGNTACIGDTCKLCGYYGAPCCDENPKPCFAAGQCRGGTCFSAAEPLPPPTSSPPIDMATPPEPTQSAPEPEPQQPVAQVPAPPLSPPPPQVPAPPPMAAQVPTPAATPTPDDFKITLKKPSKETSPAGPPKSPRVPQPPDAGPLASPTRRSRMSRSVRPPSPPRGRSRRSRQPLGAV